MLKNKLFKRITKTLIVLLTFSILFAPKVFASGSWNSTYNITSFPSRFGVLYGDTHFELNSNNVSVTVSISGATHGAGDVHISLNRRALLGWSNSGGTGGSGWFSAPNQSRTLVSGNSGTHRLVIHNRLDGAGAHW